MENDDDHADERGTLSIPKYGWKVKLNHIFPEKRSPNFMPKFRQIVQLLPLFFRYLLYSIVCYFRRRCPVMDYIHMECGKQLYGVPLGGIGSGTIGRGFKGEFCRFQLNPGIYEYNIVHANQFIITIQDKNRKTIYQQVLSPYKKPGKGALSKWKWGFKGSNASYCALYPRAWTQYDIPEFEITLFCRQISPVIPHNYKDSSIPGAVFVWTIVNNSAESKYVSITFSLKNGTGSKADKSGGVWSERFYSESAQKARGVLIHQTIEQMPCTYGIAGLCKEKVNVTSKLRFDPCTDGEEVWSELYTKGEFEDSEEVKSKTTNHGEELAAAVCGKIFISPGKKNDIEFCLVWDMPKICFRDHAKEYLRFYTKHFGTEENTAKYLCNYMLINYKSWEEEIENWQAPILNDMKLPDWYKSALFNELYFISDGGSIWINKLNHPNDDTCDPRGEYGEFAYLEGHEYRMYNTYDVHFYASFALGMLWPKLQEGIQYRISETIPQENPTMRKNLYDGSVTMRKIKNSVPHDIGDPEEEPFELINSYPIHDVSEWKDLNLKFVLQCYRDYSLFENKKLLQHFWPNIKLVMNKAMEWDHDQDGLIENSGAPDQTYDSWVMKGPSAYCGSLWLAALLCTVKIADLLGDKDTAKKYQDVLHKGKLSFEEKLWNGEYYNFDSSPGENSKTIMADQLCGLWYIHASKLENSIFPEQHVKSALQKIFDYNVMKFQNGNLGAVNGMKPNGKIDYITIQSEEVWIGVVYGLAALMIHEGMVKEAFSMASGIYKTVYEQIGLGFETPEALYEKNHYRSIGYMRPLSIWGMQLALENNTHEKLGL